MAVPFFFHMANTKITAQREGQVRKFTLQAWNAFPDHKYGWEIVKKEVPQVVAQNLARTAEPTEHPPTRGRRKQSGDPLAD